MAGGGELEVINSTITDNDGGGIYAASNTTLRIHNSIIAGNRSAGSSGSPADFLGFGEVTSDSSNNLVGDAGNAGGLVDSTNGNIVGVNGSGVRDISTVIDTTLRDNGGPTKTHALVQGIPEEK